ncbi:outer membrane protein transport protein [Vibrio sp. TBV020]|uniref:outer membrane protein transport protein n=1 Tax=Vibrio sp. TBV020 TaxID=3137398 RepID=UPI0038CD8D58
MYKKFTFAQSAILVGAALISSQANSAGFQLNAQSATGIGRAFAGDAVIADNASVMARNPAAMALFDEMSLSLGFETIITEITVSDAKYKAFATTDTVDSNYDNAGGTSVAPNIHLIVPVNDQFAWGVNLYSNFGTSTEFDDTTFAGTEYGGKTDIMSLNLGLSGSYRLSNKLSFGAGLDVIYGKGELERNANISLGGGTYSVSPCSHPVPACEPKDVTLPTVSGQLNAVKAEADGVAVGFNLGTVYELNKNNRFGLAYRYSPELEAKGDVSVIGDNDNPNSKLFIALPDMAEFSGYHRIEDSKFAVHYSIQWTRWSEFNTLDADGSGAIALYEWKDAFHYSIGTTYYLSSDWTLRAGYMYDESAQDQITSISVPDSDRQWFSAGFTYYIDSKSNIDFGFTYLMGKEVDVFEEQSIGLTSNISGTTEANAILVGLQYSRSF